MLKADFSRSYKAAIFYKETGFVYFICSQKLFKKTYPDLSVEFLTGKPISWKPGSGLESPLRSLHRISALEIPVPWEETEPQKNTP